MEPRAHILLVEDNTEAHLLVQYMLSDMCAIDRAEDASTAIVKARETRYDLVLMDINLGDERDGIDVLHALRALPSYGDVPIVAFTAYAQPGDEHRFLDAGFDVYVSKPFTKAQLRAAISQML